MNDLFFYILCLAIIIYAVLYLLATYFNDVKCVSCKYYGEKNYMIKTVDKQYYHQSCFNDEFRHH